MCFWIDTGKARYKEGEKLIKREAGKVYWEYCHFHVGGEAELVCLHED